MDSSNKSNTLTFFNYVIQYNLNFYLSKNCWGLFGCYGEKDQASCWRGQWHGPDDTGSRTAQLCCQSLCLCPLTVGRDVRARAQEASQHNRRTKQPVRGDEACGPSQGLLRGYHRQGKRRIE